MYMSWVRNSPGLNNNTHRHCLEGNSQMVVLQHRVVVVKQSQVIRCLYEELVGSAWVIHVMYCSCHEGCKYLQLREYVLASQMKNMTYMYMYICIHIHTYAYKQNVHCKIYIAHVQVHT